MIVKYHAVKYLNIFSTLQLLLRESLESEKYFQYV